MPSSDSSFLPVQILGGNRDDSSNWIPTTFKSDLAICVKTLNIEGCESQVWIHTRVFWEKSLESTNAALPCLEISGIWSLPTGVMVYQAPCTVARARLSFAIMSSDFWALTAQVGLSSPYIITQQAAFPMFSWVLSSLMVLEIFHVLFFNKYLFI